jgi:hypothetical protein
MPDTKSCEETVTQRSAIGASWKHTLQSVALLFVVVASATTYAGSQMLVNSKDLPAMRSLFDSAPLQGALPCKIWIRKRAKLDFLFRYNAGFSADCRLGVIQPGETLTALIRITPDARSPVIMIEEFDVPHTPGGEAGHSYASLDQLQVSMSGGFALGVGHYSIEVC